MTNPYTSGITPWDKPIVTSDGSGRGKGLGVTLPPGFLDFESQTRDYLDLLKTIQAGKEQIAHQEQDQKAKLSLALASHTATLKVNAAFRGVSGRSSEASVLSGQAQAGREFANIGFNSSAEYARMVSELNAQYKGSQIASHPDRSGQGLSTLLSVAALAVMFI